MSGPPSHLPALLRLTGRTLRGRAGSGISVAGDEPSRRLAVESGEMRLDERRVARWTAATGGTGIRAFSNGVLPPTYGATWETALTLELFLRAGMGLPTRGVIHLESELLQVRGIRSDERVRCRLELERVEQVSSGRVLTLRSRTWNGAGQLCTEAGTSLLLRGEGRAGASRRNRTGEQPEGIDTWQELTSWRLGGGAGRKYARASGDYNPIHLWPVTSRPFGFRRPILHGFCLQALVAHALVEQWGGGDPAALRRLRIAFRSPLGLPARPRLLVAPGPESSLDFRVADPTDERRIYAEGDAVCGS